nr:hypothetical protein [Aminipila luticellarii]
MGSIPAKQKVRKLFACRKTSPGVSILLKKSEEKITPITEHRIPKSTVKMAAARIVCANFLLSPAPTYCASMIPAPFAMPVKKLTINMVMEDAVPTAAKAVLPRNLPTMMESVI